MKTNNLFKLGLLLIFAFALSGCGQDNRSGDDRNNIFGNGAGVPVAGGAQNINALYSENPCRVNGGGFGGGYYPPYTPPYNQQYGQQPYGQQPYGQPVGALNQRRRVVVRLQGVNVAVGATYVGVTSEGDIASVYNDGSGPAMAMDLCSRGNTVQGQGQLMSNPIINKSLSCRVDEISQARVTLPGMYGPLYLNFRPVQYSGSSLCQGGMYPY